MLYQSFILILMLVITSQQSHPQTIVDHNQLAELINAINKYNISYLQQWNTLFDKSQKKQYIQALNAELYRLKKILSDVVLQDGQIEPFLKWFQNKTHIFLTIKNSHRWDSPPCLNIKSLNCNLNSNNLTYQSHCIVSYSNITFKLQLTLFDDIEHCKNSENETCEVKLVSDGVGVYSLILQKEQSGIWDYLTKQQKHYPIWQNMIQNYQSDYKLYLSRLQAIKRAKTKSHAHALPLYFMMFVLIWIF